MSVYVDQAHKNNALRDLAKRMQASLSDKAVAYADALEEILDTPVDPEQDGYLTYQFGPNFMGVMVGVPSQSGGVDFYTFTRNSGPAEPPTGVDRMIVEALLTNAKNQLYNSQYGAVAAPPPPQPYNPGF